MTPAPISVERLEALRAAATADDSTTVICSSTLLALLHQLAEREAEVERLKGVIAWVGQVYPATDAEADGAHMTVTWAQFNAMREAAGFQPAKAATKARNKSLIVRADYLRSLEAAERAREEACGLMREVYDTVVLAKPIAPQPVSLADRIAAFLAASGGA